MPHPHKTRPWLFRTYAGHSTAAASNQLFQTNLAKGQTGLSVAFDLPTQTGYDSDHPLAFGEVGKVGVPICHLGDMRALFDNIPLAQMNTSMTINATAPWLLALYIAVAEEQGAEISALKGTVQNDIIKEYLSRGTYIFPPTASLNIQTDIAAYTQKHMPNWNPMNVCSYHLQEAGALPEQELAFALFTATTVLDELQGKVPPEQFDAMVGRISFFVNAGIRFITEICKMRAFCELWNEICETRYGVTDEKMRRFRYGVQVNSLGLTEQQPENNVYRILIEMLAVTLSKNARARAVQLPAWNEALGLPRPFDQQWSLRMQQILAYETDLLEFEDIFTGNPAIERKVFELKTSANSQIAQLQSFDSIEEALGYMKAQLVQSNAARLRNIETGKTIVVGVNKWTTGEDSPLVAQGQATFRPDPAAQNVQLETLQRWRETRDKAAVISALKALKRASELGENILPASIICAKAGVTTGEWAQCLRDIHGEYRGPTGVSEGRSNDIEDLDKVREYILTTNKDLGSRLTVVIGKPGLDGHSNGAEQIATRARDCGINTIYDGIRQNPEHIIQSAVDHNAHVIGLSVLSGSHIEMAAQLIAARNAKNNSTPIVMGGIINEQEAAQLLELGIAKVYTPKDFDLNSIMTDFADLAKSNNAR